MCTIEKLALQGNVDLDYSAMMFQNHLVHIRNQHIREIVSDCIRVSGRMEYVATVCGIDFINDTKAHTLNAAWYSLESMTKPVIWIVNNMEVGEEFGKIVPLLKKKVKSVIVLGGGNGALSLFSDYVERVYTANHIEDAVELAYTIGKQGDTVLFSLAGGYDEEHKQKGKLFTETVKKL